MPIIFLSMPRTSSLLKKSKSLPKISIIIANYNGEQFLKTCLDSVLRSKYQNFEVIIVDDGSSDRSLEIIKKFIKSDNRIILIKNSKNLGAAASRNRAARKSRGGILLFLDNDTEVEKNWIDNMLKEYNRDEKIGAVQAVLLDFKKRNLIQNAGVRLWAETGWGLPYKQWENYEKVKNKLPSDIVAISAALSVKRDAFDLVKGFDIGESVATEDLDFSWRLWISGFKIRLAKDAIVYHWTKDINLRKNMQHTKRTIYFHLTKNSLVSIIKNYELQNMIYYFIYSSTISVIRGVLVLVKRFEMEALISTVQAFLWIVLNLGDTLQKREYVQKTRKNSDDSLFQSILYRRNPLFVYKNHFKQTKLL